MKSQKGKELDVNDQLVRLGVKLKKLRLEKGFTNMDHFAYEYRFGRSQYAAYETGKDIRLTTLIRLANIHGLTLAELLTFE